jgi:hypothetical protein
MTDSQRFVTGTGIIICGYILAVLLTAEPRGF